MHKAISVKGLRKEFETERGPISILQDIEFDVEKGTSLSITGPSGSGKTTLLGLLAGLDESSGGEISIEGESLHNMNEDARANLRLRKMGFVFQSFQLFPNLTALENILIPLELKQAKDSKKMGLHYLEQVGLADRASHYPNQLSGGEQQRIAIARAFANKPSILMADEPTGNLDGSTSDKIEKLLFDLNKQNGTTLIIVTHDDELAEKTDARLKLKNGRIEA